MTTVADNVEFPQARQDLEQAYKDQLLVSANVYSCDTLVLFMHDLGAFKADVNAATLDINIHKTNLINTSDQVLKWALVENKFGIIDMNFLAHQKPARPSNVSRRAGAMAQTSEWLGCADHALMWRSQTDVEPDRQLNKSLALYLWDVIVSTATATNVVFFGAGIGAQVITDLVSARRKPNPLPLPPAVPR